MIKVINVITGKVLEDCRRASLPVLARNDKPLHSCTSQESMLTLRCPKHTGYKGIKPPRVKCIQCGQLYDIRLIHQALVKNEKKK